MTRIALLLITVALVLPAAAHADSNTVAAPTDPPTADQIAAYTLLYQEVAVRAPAALEANVLLSKPKSWQLNVATARYREVLGLLPPIVRPPVTAPEVRSRKATRRTLGRYTTWYRRCLRAPRSVCHAGYNIRHGLRRCWINDITDKHLTCHRRQPYQGELRRRIVRYRARLKHRPLAHNVSAAVWRNMTRIRGCESGGNYHAVGQGGGAYGHFGAWQFSLPTWASVGGRGNPVAASREEQDRRAILLFKRRGYQPWECARILGII